MRSICFEGPGRDRDGLDRILSPWRGKTLGLIGFGERGRRIRASALSLNMTVLLCDPLLAMEQSGEEYDDLLTQWGNGMGGCLTVRDDPVVFLPLTELLKRADVIAAAVPRNAETEGMIDLCFTSALKPGCVVLNFSAPETVHPDADGSKIRSFRFSVR